MRFRLINLYKKCQTTKAYAFSSDLLKRSSRDRVTISAAALSFHGILAFFPAVVSLIGILHLVGLNSRDTSTVVHYVTLILPSEAASVVSGSLKARESTGTSSLEVVFGSLVALWSLTGAMASLQVGLDLAYELPKDRSFIKRRLASIPLVGISILFVLLIFVDLIGGTFLIRHVGHLSGVGAAINVVEVVLVVFRLLVAVALALILLSIYFTFGSAKKSSIKKFAEVKTFLSLGSMVALIAWAISLVGFSYYLAHFSNTTRSYGLFGSMIVMMLWMFITAYFLFMGAEINSLTAQSNHKGKDI